MRLSLAIVLALLIVPSLGFGIGLGQIDDFETGLQNWRSGSNNPNPPEAVILGGGSDRVMVVTANGGSGAGSKLVVFNLAQWSGDYIAAGVTGVSLDLENLSSTELMIRLVVRGAGGSFASDAVDLPAGANLGTVILSLLPNDLTHVGVGPNDVDATLSNVTELRILHSAVPQSVGDVVDASIAVDDITAVQVFECAAGLKADTPADVLILPSFEVDTTVGDARTTYVSVHNGSDETLIARVSFFDTSSDLLRQDDVELVPHRTWNMNIRDMGDLAVDPDDIARGWVQIQTCRSGAVFASSASGSPKELGNHLWGDWLVVDHADDFASGDQLLQPADLCTKLASRLLDFGSGVRLRLFITDPQGEASPIPTATLTVYNEAGQMLETHQVFTDDTVVYLDLGGLLTTRFGMVMIEFSEGLGAALVEYTAFGRFSVAMNATCVNPPRR
jgi:hypothetical protein